MNLRIRQVEHGYKMLMYDYIKKPRHEYHDKGLITINHSFFPCDS